MGAKIFEFFYQGDTALLIIKASISMRKHPHSPLNMALVTLSPYLYDSYLKIPLYSVFPLPVAINY